MSEENIFLNSEADAWYKRNTSMLVPEVRTKDAALSLLRRRRLRPKRVLEVGSSNGWRLEALRVRNPHATYTGVDPSRAAVSGGKRLFPKLKLLRGVASALPVKGVFDLVLVPFVLHWVSREKLLASIAEIDRTVAEEGYLLVNDFLPHTPRRNRYHHLKTGVSTWKTDYGSIFLSSGNYQLVERVVYDYETSKPATVRTPDNQRATVSLYKKKLGVGYRQT